MNIPFPDTERLYFRKFDQSYLNLVYELNSDPKVMKYLLGVRNRKEAQEDLQRYIGYYHKHPGYGFWPAFIKGQQEFVGWFLIKISEETGETEIGYRLKHKYWGQGLATEGAKNIRDYAFSHLSVNRIIGVVLPGNEASCRVLEKIGLRFQKVDQFYDCQCAYYVLDRPHE